MIQLIRIDDRLLHGQVAVSWKAELNYEAIVIASDSAAEDEIRKAALKLAKPDGVLIAIRSVNDSIELLKNEKLQKLNVFVVTDTIENAQRLYEGLDENPTLNIGGIQQDENKKPVVSYAYLSEQDINILKTLEQDGHSIEFRLVPSDKITRLKQALKD